ncbi:histidine kinase [Aureisphaera sp. CAU 1614]|uniref:Histidine kinase n=1 Tax=Halomarinibacterium sedimenti TaxID=2857106 RepID=A0A9X1FR16_9FLAO|nr:histidine kinase [Halomarinibacterium sedimenti]MBW2939036.1 histidine kinase [Halomarinibacterium sedimenti]
MKRILSICFLLFFSGILFCSAQNKATSQPVFLLKGKVVNAADYSPISKVNIEITGKGYTTTNNAGEFVIEARIGDELVVRSDDFKTVYYIIKDQQKITVEVEKVENEAAPISTRSRSANKDFFRVYIDSANYFLKKDAKRSIEYVTKALESVTGKNPTNLQNAVAFETLGDINLQWQLPDLALSNYKQSVNFSPNINTRIKLAKAYMRNGNYQESIQEYKNLLKADLTPYQQVEAYEGLGDNYKATNDAVKSVFNYQKGLDIANQKKISPKITDLNSKIGEAYAKGGAIEEAQTYFENSLTLSKSENKKRAVEEKNKVADFYNQKRDFDREIELRQETLDEIQSMDAEESEDDINSPLTPQRQNYKIANAYVAQDKYQEAIPFLEKSIAEADKKEDLVVQKDATRKLSEIYRDIGDYGKAAESYERYVEVVDELYIKKEQELSQATRFSKEIALRQNRITSLENERKLNESRYKLAFENQELIEKNNKIQKWIIGSLIVIALLLLFTAYTQRKNVQQQKFANNLLALKSLRTQMNPHFIFNALNSVNSFIASNDERAANKYLSEFSQLMRSVLENSEEDFIPLSKEIELLELYVKLEHFRFKDKFDYEVTVDESINVDDFVIPPMLLQPYVENAVWHGLRYKEDKGMLKINFQQKDKETVIITIEDDGIGRKKSKELKTENQKKQKSKGMGNIQKRISILNEMYKDKVDVIVEDAFENEAGTLVRLTLKKD